MRLQEWVLKFSKWILMSTILFFGFSFAVVLGSGETIYKAIYLGSMFELMFGVTLGLLSPIMIWAWEK